MKNFHISLTCTLLFLLNFPILAQVRITIFYDSTWAMNSREQAAYYRNTFLDTTYIALIGPVQDHYADGQLAMKGKYEAGKKQGKFQFFYPNGREKVNGSFVNDYPVGTWRYYHPDGSAWQTIEFLVDDYKIVRYFDKSGIQKVINGSGRYEGLIYSYAQGDTLYVDGVVENGLKEGIWVYYNDNGKIVYEEKYKKGQFRNTTMYNAQGSILGRFDKPVGYNLILPFELLHTERFVYAPDIKQSDYPYFDFLPDEDTVYFDEEWEVCDSLSATYFRPTNVKNVESPTGYMRNYYMNGTLQMVGRFIEGAKVGKFRYYHKNGQLSSEGIYQNGQKTGVWRDYYPDGSFRQEVFYEDNLLYVERYWSPEGELLVMKGNGKYDAFIKEENQTIRVEGNFKDYLREGLWKGYREDGRLYFEEEYDRGKLLSGTSYDKAGNEYTYVTVKSMALPANGMKHFYAFVSRHLEYPMEARKLNIEGKVFTELVVDKQGKISNVKTVKSPHSLLSKASEKVIRMYDGWQAGRVRGQLVKMRFVLPITFSLGNF